MLIKGHGHILIMDDEPSILSAASHMLSAAGYRVKCVKDGDEAVAAYRNALAGEPFNAVILDLTIPGGMGGQEACQKIRTLDPEAKIIVSSGYSTDSVMANYREYGFIDILVKPYGIHAITTVVKRVVGI